MKLFSIPKTPINNFYSVKRWKVISKRKEKEGREKITSRRISLAKWRLLLRKIRLWQSSKERNSKIC
jgi:hypothetical protein